MADFPDRTLSRAWHRAGRRDRASRSAIVLRLLSGGMVSLLVSLGASGARAAEPEPVPATGLIRLSVSSWAPPGHLLHESIVQWCAALATRRPLTVVCDLLEHPVAPIQDTLSAVARNAVDIAIVAHGVHPDRHVLPRLAELPMAGASAQAVSIALEKTRMASLRQVDEYPGAHVLAVFTQLPEQLYTVRGPIRTLDDLAGLTLRSGGGVGSQVVAALSALGVKDRSLPMIAIANEVADHLLDGALLAADNADRIAVAGSFAHLWIVPGGLSRQSFALVINAQVWQRLSVAQRQVLETVGGSNAARLFGRAADELDASLQRRMAAAGLNPSVAGADVVRDLRERLAPVAAAWIDDAGRRGLPQAARVLRDYRERVRGIQQAIDRRS